LQRIRKRPFRERSVMFVARLAFRGIYFPQMKRRDWVALIWSNRGTLGSLCQEALISLWKDSRNKRALKQEKLAT
jgi:hypothetical protein